MEQRNAVPESGLQKVERAIAEGRFIHVTSPNREGGRVACFIIPEGIQISDIEENGILSNTGGAYTIKLKSGGTRFADIITLSYEDAMSIDQIRQEIEPRGSIPSAGWSC